MTHLNLFARFFVLVIVLALVLSFVGSAGQATGLRGPVGDQSARPIRHDPNGDPVPEGALARAGSTRFRHSNPVNQVAFAPDGKTIYSTSYPDKAARAWDVATGREFQSYGGEHGVWAVAVSPDGHTVATSDAGNAIRLWEAATGREVRVIKRGEAAPQQFGRAFFGSALVDQLRFAPDGKTLYTLHMQENAVVAWDVESGKESRTLSSEGPAAIFRLALTADGKTLVTADSGGMIRVWEASSGRQQRQFGGAGEQFLDAALSPDGTRVVTVAGDHSLHFWDAAAGRETQSVKLTGYARGVTFAPDGTIVALACHQDERATIILFDSGGKELRQLDGFFRDTETLAFAPDGKTLATAGGDGTIRFWDVTTGKELRPTPGHPGSISTAVFSPDGKLLATCSTFDPDVRLWDAATGREVFRLKGHTTGVDEVQFSSEGNLVAAAAYGQPLWIWDARTGLVVKKIDSHPTLGPYLRFSRDGKLLATAGRNNTAGVRDIGSGKLIREYSVPANGIHNMLAFADGRMLALENTEANDDGETPIVLWDLAAKRVVRRFVGHKGRIIGAALSPDARSLLSRGDDKTIRIWEVATGRERCSFQEKGENNEWSGTQFLALSPDGRLLVSAGTADPFARVWDVSAGRELPPLHGHKGWVCAVEFSADGRTLVTGSQDSTSLLWDMADPTRRPKPATGQLTEDELTKQWSELRNADPSKAHSALWALAGTGDQAVRLAAARLRPATPADQERISRWIAELDHAQYAVRERASIALARVADQVDDQLRTALATTRSSEAQQRIRRLLDSASEVELSADRLGELRVIELLEVLGTPEARRLLEDLGRGAAGASLSREAQAALRRLIVRNGSR